MLCCKLYFFASGVMSARKFLVKQLVALTNCWLQTNSLPMCTIVGAITLIVSITTHAGQLNRIYQSVQL